MEKDKETIIKKVKKLFALANSSNEHEAALAAAHAQRLLAEHNLAMSDIEARQEATAANKVETSSAKALPKWIWRLLNGVNQAFDSDCVHYSGGKIVFIGVGADPQVAAYTFSYLDKTILTLPPTSKGKKTDQILPFTTALNTASRQRRPHNRNVKHERD